MSWNNYRVIIHQVVKRKELIRDLGPKKTGKIQTLQARSCSLSLEQIARCENAPLWNLPN